MNKVLAVSYPSGGRVDVVVLRDGVIHVCPGTVKTEKYAQGIDRPGWYMVSDSAEDVGVTVEGLACSTMPAELTLGAWLGQKTLFWFVDYGLLDDGADVSYILYSQNPDYILKKGPSGKRRWMLAAESGLILPKDAIMSPSAILLGGRSEGDFLEDIKGWTHHEFSEGHSELYVVDTNDGKRYTLKWNDLDAAWGDLLRDTFGASTPVDLLPEYEEIYRTLAAPYMPQWSPGDLDDLEQAHPELYEHLIKTTNARELLESDVEPALSPLLVASPFVDHKGIDWRHLGETPEEAMRNLAFLQYKQWGATALVGPPDRDNPGNHLVYWLEDEKGNPLELPEGLRDGNHRRHIAVDIDYDWIPLDTQNFDSGVGAYTTAGNKEFAREEAMSWDEAQQEAGRIWQETAEACDCGFNFDDVKEQLLHEGQAHAGEEAFLDIASRFRDIVRIPKGEGPFKIFEAMEEQYLADGELQEAVEAWEEVREDRLKGSA